jgi:PST family polysaccharide transporter
MASTGAQLAIPLILLAMLTAADVGLFRAVATISVGYLTFFLASLTQDYLPRISEPNTPVTLGILLENRMRLVIGLGLPLILALFAGASLLLEILYSSDFVVATDLLRWYLIGDLVRLPAWVLAFTLLARGQAEYFAVELAGGILLLGSTVLAVSAFGFVGAGIAYAAAQLGYFGLVWILVRRSVVTTPGRLQLVVLLAMAGCTALLLTETHPLVIAVVSASASVVTASAAWHRLSRRAQVGQL